MEFGFRERKDDLLNHSAIEAVWTFFCLEDTSHYIVPDGRADLVFTFDIVPSGAIKNVKPIIVTPFRVAHCISSRAHQGYLGVRFKSGCAGTLLNMSLHSIMGGMITGPSTLSYVPWLQDLRTEYRSVSRLLDFLNQKFILQPDVIVSSDIGETLNLIDASSDTARIGNLARDLNLPVRSLSRRFTRSVGVSPKQYVQIARIRKSVQKLVRGAAASADVALDCGFSDQAHMTREVKRFMRHTPTQLNVLAEDGQLLS